MPAGSPRNAVRLGHFQPQVAIHGVVWVAMITSADNERSPSDVAIADLGRAGLPAPSVVRPAKIAADAGSLEFFLEPYSGLLAGIPRQLERANPLIEAFFGPTDHFACFAATWHPSS
jgi:hypothetical protein